MRWGSLVRPVSRGAARMMSNSDLKQLKRRLSPQLLRIDGVRGVGLPNGRLTVYLAEDSAGVRRDVDTVLSTEAPNMPVTYVATGPFRAHEIPGSETARALGRGGP